MSKCFDFTSGQKGKEINLPELKTLFDLCQQRRDEGRAGFLVRADSLIEAKQRLDSLSSAHRDVETVFIL